MTGYNGNARRFLKILSRSTKIGYKFAKEDEEVLIYTPKVVRFPNNTVSDLVKRGAILQHGSSVKITRKGLELLKQLAGLELNSTPDFASDNTNPTHLKPHLNLDESPLARLFARKTKNGRGYISEEEFNAGERLRADFERGNLQPRVSANLGMMAGLSGKGGFHQAHEVSDFAIDSRQRVNKAVQELGPELSGVVLDVCCFLKGLETIERERQWPPRSAKLMLKTALSKLARYYGITNSHKTNRASVSAWGSDDYRPQM